MSKESDAFERELCETLGRCGFWASIFPKAHDGSQPADIIAINKDGKHLIDAKLCANGRFEFRRMEENQVSAMRLFEERAGGKGWFAVKYPDGVVYMLSQKDLELFETVLGMRSIKEIPESCELENWIYGYRDR